MIPVPGTAAWTAERYASARLFLRFARDAFEHAARADERDVAAWYERACEALFSAWCQRAAARDHRDRVAGRAVFYVVVRSFHGDSALERDADGAPILRSYPEADAIARSMADDARRHFARVRPSLTYFVRSIHEATS